MNTDKPILVDICWTLFYSNTTYDFLHIRGNRLNSLLYKLFGYDYVRARAICRLRHLTHEQLLTRAEQFYTDYLEPRKIAPVWQLIEGRDIILVSQTMPVIAEVVARHTGARAYHSLQDKQEVLSIYRDFDIVTDNLTDIELIRHAGHATIVTYNNRSRWERLLPHDISITYIDTNRSKY